MSTERDFDIPHGCEWCDQGHRRFQGTHVPDNGMIPVAMCSAIVARHVGNATEINARPWIAYIDGCRYLTTRGFSRRFTSEDAALRAARKASTDRPPGGAHHSNVSE